MSDTHRTDLKLVADQNLQTSGGPELNSRNRVALVSHKVQQYIAYTTSAPATACMTLRPGACLA